MPGGEHKALHQVENKISITVKLINFYLFEEEYYVEVYELDPVLQFNCLRNFLIHGYCSTRASTKGTEPALVLDSSGSELKSTHQVEFKINLTVKPVIFFIYNFEVEYNVKVFTLDQFYSSTVLTFTQYKDMAPPVMVREEPAPGTPPLHHANTNRQTEELLDAHCKHTQKWVGCIG